MKAGIFALLLLACNWMHAQITVDGQFEDWTQDTVVVNDPTGDGSTHDFVKLIVSSDAEHLFVSITSMQPFGLQDNNDLKLYIDTDNSPSTGTPIHGMGADLIWELGHREGSYHSQNLQHADIGLVTAPTVTASTFELQISREKINLTGGGKVRVLLVDDASHGDEIPNTGTLTHTLRNIDYGYSPVLLEKAKTDHLRVMSYNVLFNGITKQERIPHFSRIFKAIQPDVIAFNELFDTDANQVKSFLDTHLPLDNSHGWYTQKVDYGNVTASRYPIVETWEVYPGRRISAFLIDLPHRFPKDLLAINAHLKCCSADETRQDEVDAIAAFYRDIKNEGGDIDLPDGTPFMLLGDLNLVGDRQQLQTLLTGDIINEEKYGADVNPDWDGTAMHDLLSYHSDEQEAFTWWNPSSSYYPGRLDYMILSESAINVEKHFLLRTKSMSQDRLQTYGLQQDDTREASDHLPKVADLSFETSTGFHPGKAPNAPFKIFPNPTQGMLTIHFDKLHNDAALTLHNQQGSQVWQATASNQQQQVNMDPLPAGFYTLVIQTRQATFARKILKQVN